MCRFLAYAATKPVAAADLAPATFAEFRALSGMNADGWGMAWYGDGQSPSVARSLQSAGDDQRFMDEASRAHGELGIVHLRSATPPLSVDLANSHPFVFGEYAMAHNGAIYPPWGQEQIDVTAVVQMVPTEWRDRLNGTSDSAYYFKAMMAAIGAGGSVVDACREVVGRISSELLPTCLNTLMIAPDALYALCWYQDEPYPKEYYKLFTPDQLYDYFHLRYKQENGTFVIASTGWPQDGWSTLRRNHLLRVERGTLRMTEYDLFSSNMRELGGARSACTTAVRKGPVTS